MVFIGNLLLARRAGADTYGTYVHIFNWISILGVVATGGREDLVLSEITRYQVGNQPWLIGFLVKRTNRLIFIASAGVGLFFLTIIWLFPIKTLHEYRIEFLIAAAAIYFTAFITLNQSILQALNHIRLSQFVEKLVKPGLLILFLLLAGILDLRIDTDGRQLILLMEGVQGICCLLLGWFVIQRTKPYSSSGAGMVGGGHLTKKTFYFFFITLLTVLITKITMLLLPRFAQPKDIGIFNICYRFSDLIVYPFFLMHTVLPQLFARHNTSDITRKQSLYNTATRLMTVLSLPLLALNFFAGRYFLGWFGEEFADGYTALLLLSASQFLYSIFGPANTILMMQDQEKYSVICLLIYVLVLILTSLWLIPTLGITGGALAMLVSCLFYNIILSVCAYRLSRVVSPFLSFLTGAKG
jgi:O-antigen/teichoic acid export membrane protein